MKTSFDLTVYQQLVDAHGAGVINAGLECDIPLHLILDTCYGHFVSDEEFVKEIHFFTGVFNEKGESVSWDNADQELRDLFQAEVLFFSIKSNNYYFSYYY